MYFITSKSYTNGVYDAIAEEYSSVIYYVGDKGLDRELLEAERQVSSQRTAIFTLSDASSVYIIIGEIMADVTIPKDIVVEFNQTPIGEADNAYFNNTVYAFFRFGNNRPPAQKDLVIAFVLVHMIFALEISLQGGAIPRKISK